MRILSIEGWRNECGGWDWNSWHCAGREITKERFEACGDSTRKFLNLIREETGLDGRGMVAIEDDGYNIVAVQRHTREPLYAIEYGPEY